MDAYALHLAVAALVGASVVAVSAYYMHRKTLSQVLDFARAVERERDRRRGAAVEGEEDEPRRRRRDQYGPRCKSPGYYRRVGGSASLPDVTAAADTDGEEEDEALEEQQPLTNGPFLVEEDQKGYPIPAGLPRLQTVPEGNKESMQAVSNKRSGHIIRPTSPKSSVHSTFGSQDGSEEDDNMENDAKLDDAYVHTNGHLIGDNSKSLFQTLPDHIVGIGDPKSLTASSMIRSLSVSGDLHGVQPDPVAADILRREPEQETFVRLKITPTERPSPDEEDVYMIIQKCLALRESYVFREEVAPWEKEVITDPSTPKPNPNPFAYVVEQKTDHVFHMVDGVVHVYANKALKERLFPVADATTFFTDLHHILRVLAVGNIRTLCHQRLDLLEQKFNLHLMLNADREFLAQKSAPHRDFYNVRKVDTHVHHSACMNQKHLLRFIKSKLRKEPDEVVIFRDGTYMTLKEVFESLDLTGYDLNVDLLDVHADKSTFHRFDKFNLKYNPCGQSRLREIFLKQDNLIQGRFLAELTKQVFSDLAASKYQMAEYRISIYGRKQSEWDQLASWIVNNELYSENVVWLIQIPRLYNIYKEMGIVNSFQNLLDNIFLPLFEVTVDPDSHPQLHVFLKQVVGLDLVDDESKPERRPTKHMPTPEQWTNVFNPAFSYYAYYCYANLYTLNKLRESKGLTTIKFRPHSGETGDIDHLAATFLCANNIAHGINLRKSPVLQYLYYLAQIGLAMSPLSNNSLFLDYHRNPFPVFFRRGLNVSLSTDDPLQIHLTKEPLVEEYSIAASVWKLSACDLCEIARYSVYQSGFSHALKSHWIGKHYYKRGPDGNDIHRTNVPHIRLEFRDMIWREEMQLVYLGKPIIPKEMEK
ncbi:probable AMP deaminase [Zingiber officinale]|uniref:probable AMP deaminase isoform X1 n=1 Tax=Zingiber officinale TaxID=94328 RepID=UPI001C4D4321|nr:probable AMP deaminase isoform X1 [Zingiber officinale]XP_042416411.1 probable AMP deaminase [Zingiber officinale]